MDFALSEEQEMIRKAARDFLAEKCPASLVREMEKDSRGYPPDLWTGMAGLGWLGLIFPEKYGGSGGSLLDMVILMEEAGRACLPVPFFATVITGGVPILLAGSEEIKRSFLPDLARGKLIVTLALTEPAAGWNSESIQTEAVAEEGGYRITGTKLFVPCANVADWIVCVARASGNMPGKGLSMFLVNARSPGISITELKTIASDKQCEVIFDKVRVPKENLLGEENKGWEVVEKVIRIAAIAKCAEMVGGAQKVLEMAADYAKQRVQFGVPIGSFQAIQHYLAEMLTDVDASRFITYKAGWTLSESLKDTSEASIAKAWVSDAYRRVCAKAHQIFGTIGYTSDHDMQLYTRRAKAGELAFGDSRFHRERIACEMGMPRNDFSSA